MSIPELREFLHNPLVLLCAMYLAMLVSMGKQIVSARQDGATVMTCYQYFTKFPIETLGAILANLLAFALLVETNTLNLASALGLGYASNSLADLLQANGRSAVLSGQKKMPNGDPPPDDGQGDGP
jgi:hypothetical protein